jgi:hypothetical protein
MKEMTQRSDIVIDRVKVREVAGVFRSRDALDAAAAALLVAGFDRADIDQMAGADAVRQKLGGIYPPAEELADVPNAPRRAFIARGETLEPMVVTTTILAYVGAAAAILGVVASGGSVTVALAAGALGGIGGGSIGVLIARCFGKEEAGEIPPQMAAVGLILWVRVRSPEREDKAQQILRDHGGEAVRVHEIEIDKRLEHLPLSSLLADELLAHPS